MNLATVKELVARTFGVGIKRVRIIKPEEVAEAMTREDIRRLVHKGAIKILYKRGVSRHRAREKKRKKSKGRRRGPGSRKGEKYSRKNRKELWMEKIRAIRKKLKELRARGIIDSRTYRKLYRLAKGGAIRSKRHVEELVGLRK